MATGYVRSWTDVSAPQLSQSPGDLEAVLQAVLVDGYGATPGLGWSTVFTSGNTKVFRGISGTAPLLFRSSPYSGDDGVSVISLFESMADADNGIGRTPNGIIELYIDHSGVDASYPGTIPWKIIGDDRGFYIFYQRLYRRYPTTLGQMWACTYVGEYTALDPSNLFNYFIAGSQDTNTHSGLDEVTSSQNSVHDNYWIWRDSTGDAGSTRCGISSGCAYETTAFGYTPFSDFAADKVRRFSVPLLNDANSKPLGYLPGLLNPLMRFGDNGVAISTYTSLTEIVSGGQTAHIFRIRHLTEDYTLPTAICVVSGEGFRNVI